MTTIVIQIGQLNGLLLLQGYLTPPLPDSRLAGDAGESKPEARAVESDHEI